MNTSLSATITSFFTAHLPKVMGYSDNTIKSYRDTFVLLFNYADEKHLCPKGRISIDIFKKENIIAFLDWLEDSRNASISTRNQRLAALKSFSKYASTNEIEYLDIFQQILNIKPKKGFSKTVSYLSVDAVALLLKQPESNTRNGLRDLALLSLLYESGCRVQELIDVKQRDISLNVPATISVIGKGSKVRIIPLSSNMIAIIRKYICENKISSPDQYLFTNRQNAPLTRSGIKYILGKYVTKAKSVDPTLFGNENVHPHVLRHSKAMHLVQANVNLIYIRDFLGHESVKTTEIYAKADSAAKREALEKASEKIIPESRYKDKKREELLDWLKEMI